MSKFVTLFTICIAVLAAVSNAAFAPAANTAKSSSLFHNPRVSVSLSDGEPIENAIKRFKREVSKSGHLFELRHKRYFENTQERKKRKIREAGMRRRMERIQKKRQSNFNA